MIEIRLHGRGGQGAVTANEILAEAAYLDGKFSQAIPMYGTERRGAPVTAFLRIDDVRVRERDLVHEPDIVVCLDPAIAQRPSVVEGIKPGGLFIANYPYPAEKLPLGGDFKVAVIDATKIALDTLGRPITNTSILGAFSKITGLVKLESVEKAVMHRFPGRMGEMNVNAVRKSYELATMPIQAKGEVKKDEEGALGGGGYGSYGAPLAGERSDLPGTLKSVLNARSAGYPAQTTPSTGLRTTQHLITASAKDAESVSTSVPLRRSSSRGR